MTEAEPMDIKPLPVHDTASSKQAKRSNRHNNRKKKNKAGGGEAYAASEATRSSGPDSHPSYSPYPGSVAGNSHVIGLGSRTSGIATPASSNVSNELFEYRDVLHGDDEFGALFATMMIPAGTRLADEAPLMSLSKDNANSFSAIYDAFAKLSDSEQASILALQPRPPPALEEWACLIDALIEQYFELYTKHARADPSIGINEINVMNMLGPRVQHLCTSYRIASRFLAYRQSLIDTPATEHHTIPSHIPVSGLFLAPNYLQHSCIPNCHVAINSTNNLLTIHAIRPIAPGELLTTSYIGTRIWYHSYAKRTELLDSLHQLPRPCNCGACNTQHPDFPKHEEHRSVLHLNTNMVSGFLTGLDATRNPDMYFNALHGSTSANPKRADTNPFPLCTEDQIFEAATKVESSLHLLKATGCHDLELVRWRNVLVNVLLKELGHWDQASRLAEESLLDAERCLGKDHPEYEMLERMVAECGRRGELKKLRKRMPRGKGDGKVRWVGGRRV